MEEKVTLNDIKTFSDNHGQQKTSKLLSVLGKNRQFIDAWETPAGKEILSYLLAMIDIRLDKLINEETDEKDRAEYRVCLELLANFKDKINSHKRNFATLKRG